MSINDLTTPVAAYIATLMFVVALAFFSKRLRLKLLQCVPTKLMMIFLAGLAGVLVMSALFYVEWILKYALVVLTIVALGVVTFWWRFLYLCEQKDAPCRESILHTFGFDWGYWMSVVGIVAIIALAVYFLTESVWFATFGGALFSGVGVAFFCFVRSGCSKNPFKKVS